MRSHNHSPKLDQLAAQHSAAAPTQPQPHRPDTPRVACADSFFHRTYRDKSHTKAHKLKAVAQPKADELTESLYYSALYRRYNLTCARFVRTLATQHIRGDIELPLATTERIIHTLTQPPAQRHTIALIRWEHTLYLDDGKIEAARNLITALKGDRIVPIIYSARLQDPALCSLVQDAPLCHVIKCANIAPMALHLMRIKQQLQEHGPGCTIMLFDTDKSQTDLVFDHRERLLVPPGIAGSESGLLELLRAKLMTAPPQPRAGRGSASAKACNPSQ